MARGTRCSGGGKLSGSRAQPVHHAIQSSTRVRDRVTNPDCSARPKAEEKRSSQAKAPAPPTTSHLPALVGHASAGFPAAAGLNEEEPPGCAARVILQKDAAAVMAHANTGANCPCFSMAPHGD